MKIENTSDIIKSWQYNLNDHKNRSTIYILFKGHSVAKAKICPSHTVFNKYLQQKLKPNSSLLDR